MTDNLSREDRLKNMKAYVRQAQSRKIRFTENFGDGVTDFAGTSVIYSASQTSQLRNIRLLFPLILAIGMAASFMGIYLEAMKSIGSKSLIVTKRGTRRLQTIILAVDGLFFDYGNIN